MKGASPFVKPSLQVAGPKTFNTILPLASPVNLHCKCQGDGDVCEEYESSNIHENLLLGWPQRFDLSNMLMTILMMMLIKMLKMMLITMLKMVLIIKLKIMLMTMLKMMLMTLLKMMLMVMLKAMLKMMFILLITMLKVMLIVNYNVEDDVNGDVKDNVEDDVNMMNNVKDDVNYKLWRFPTQCLSACLLNNTRG